MRKLKSRWLKVRMPIVFVALATMIVSGVVVFSQTMQELKPFPPPKKEPPVITPGRTPSDPPSDAIVLFDGKDLSAWRSASGSGEARWQVRDGYMEVVAKTGDIATKQEFGDCQLHIEWATPTEVKGEGQERGNSGVLLM